MFDNLDDARQALSGTIVRYQNEAYYVNDVTGRVPNLLVSVYKIPVVDGNRMDIRLDSPELDLKFSPYGYLNIEDRRSHDFKRAGWVSRIAARQYRQGAAEGNTNVNYDDGRSRFLSVYIREPGVAKLFSGAYPTIGEAVDELRRLGADNGFGFRPSIAIDRDIALAIDPFRTDVLLYYRGERVGWSDLQTVMLPKRFHYLQQVMEEKSGLRNVQKVT